MEPSPAPEEAPKPRLKPSLKSAANTVVGDVKMRRVAQMALLAATRSKQEKDNAENEENEHPQSQSPLAKLKAATQTIIATQQLQAELHPAFAVDQSKDGSLTPAQALTRLTGTIFTEVPNSLPQQLHQPLVLLVNIIDSISASIEAFKAALDGIIHWEAIVNSLYITAAVFCAWFVGYWNLGLGWVFVIMFFVNGAYRRNMQRVKVKVGVETARVLGLKKLENDAETVEWFNQFLKRFWVQFEPSLSESLKNTIDPILSSSKPAFLDELALTVFTLGSEAPRIDQIKTIMLAADDVLVMEWALLFVPVDEDGVSKRQKELGNVRHSKIEVVAKIGKGVVAIPIPVVVEQIEFRANLRLEFKFVSKYPHISKIEYLFTDTPVVDFTLRPLKALDLMDMPGLKNSLNQILSYALSGYVSPHRNYIDLDAMFNGTGAEVPVGVLKVTLHEAKGLKNFELAGISDPYVLVRLAGKEVARSKTIGNSLNPYWGQTLYIPVLSTHLNFSLDSPMDTLELEVFDDNDTANDKSMGLIAPVQLSRWVKLLEKNSVVIPAVTSVAPAAERASSSTGSSTESAEAAPTTEERKPLSCGEDLTSSERETLITDWGTPHDVSGSDVWHLLSTKDAHTSKEKRRDLGSLRLEMAYLPVTSLESLVTPTTSTSANKSASPATEKPPDLSARSSTDTLISQPTPVVDGIFTVTVHSGKEFNGSKVSSLGCDVFMNDIQTPWKLCGSTPAVKKSNNPTWDVPVRFYVCNSDASSVKVIVKDGNKSLGDVLLEVKDLVAGLTSKDITPIDWYKVNGVESGKIRMTFQWHPIDPLYHSDKSMTSTRKPKGVLKFKLVKAKSLINVEIMGRKSDPYAKIHVGQATLGASLVKDNTLDPVWNETFYGVVYSKTQKLSIELFDYNHMKKDKALGSVELKFEDIIKFRDLDLVHSKEMQKYMNDGLKVEFSGKSIHVLAPIYLSKTDLEDNEKEREKDKKGAASVSSSSQDISPMSPTTRDPTDIKAALLQRGFLYFEMEYYDVLEPETHVIALEYEQYEFIERIKNDLVKEISRLKKLEEVKVLTPEDAAARIENVKAKGYVGELSVERAELLKLPRASDVMQNHDSGILRFHIHGSQGVERPINGYVDIRVDGESCFMTRIQKNESDPAWNATIDICIRSVKEQVVTIHLLDSRDGENKNVGEDREVGVWSGFLTTLVGYKKWIVLGGKDGASGDGGGDGEVKVNVSLGYLPINTCLSDTIHSSVDVVHLASLKCNSNPYHMADSGMLYIDLHGATNLEAVDSGGTSDPYCLVHLNDDLVHKTHVHKKNLNPTFNESINIPIRSRLKSTINFILKDYNAIGKHTTMGTAEFDLMDIKSGELLKLAIPLKGARSGELLMSLFFDYQAGGTSDSLGSLKKMERTTIDASSRLDKREDNVAIKYTKGLGQGTVGAFKEIGKQFMGAPKQSQNQTFSAVERANFLGADVRNLTNLVPKMVVEESGGSSSVHGSPQKSISGTVILTIEAARDLKAVDENGEADPYVKVHQLLHGKDKILYKTKVVKKNRNPEWHESVQFRIPPSSITLVLKDFNMFGSSKPLGEVELDLNRLFAKLNWFDVWVAVGLGGMGELHIKGQLQRDLEAPRSISSLSVADDVSLEDGGSLQSREGSRSPRSQFGRMALSLKKSTRL
ncbi:UNVERIFIED_CONTAM: hypothetical protein HDU68_009253 [Siphonaria sp. JEL0065]|nr:hypothetical protein HDU68_009253 [Siphonaria sp. JEL0065]